MLFITKTIHIYLITPIGEKIVVFDPWKLPKQTYQEMTMTLIGSIILKLGLVRKNIVEHLKLVRIIHEYILY